ncbi:ABC transporter permease [Clostridium oryzae]|uniref:Putative multiple-sugar transport system permease YteP n=1 Tax=Clostridium oryzae TaxID=1450648 RepID=A0A1V4IDX7_9CLOT|nr:ABC transporter permease subunit [Clostridium oryzae]OPJ58129.1 putative multiple-sugar transport system permease YteP [Clostridium oryzae]
MEVKYASESKRLKKPFLKELRKNKALFLMLTPGLLLLLIINYLPMIGTLIAFKDYKNEGNNFFESFMLSKWVGFNNFKFLLKSPDTFTITRNTICYNLVFIVVGTIFAVFLSIGINELRNKRTAKLYQSAMLLPYFLSWVVISFLFFGFLSVDKGIINKDILVPLGKKAIEWYSAPKYWPFILVFANLLKYSGYNCIIYLASLTGIDEELYEAAILDGATKWQQITKITIPLLSSVIIIMTLLAVGRIFNADFGLFFNVPMNSGPLFESTNVIDTYVYRGLMNNGDIGMSSAAGLYQSVVGFILILLANFIVRKIDKEKALF